MASAAAPSLVRLIRPPSLFRRGQRRAGICDAQKCRQPSKPPLGYRAARALRAISACRCTLRIEIDRGLRHGPNAALRLRYLRVEGMRKRVARHIAYSEPPRPFTAINAMKRVERSVNGTSRERNGRQNTRQRVGRAVIPGRASARARNPFDDMLG